MSDPRSAGSSSRSASASRQIKVRPIYERIVRTDILAVALNAGRLGVGRGRQRLVELACGHTALTSAKDRCVCHRCTEMLQRSITDGGADYDGFRHRGMRDDMSWAEDPCRQFNEAHQTIDDAE